MKVLQINSVCGSGSTGRIAVDLYKVLEENGHECMIAYGRGDAPRYINSYKIGSKINVNLHGIYTRITDKHGFASKFATKKFIKVIDHYSPDIIQLHNIHGYYLNIEILFQYLKQTSIPIVWTLHDCWSLTGHCAHFDLIGCNKWQKQCENCIQKKKYPASQLLDSSKWNYKRKKQLFTSIDNMMLITPSEWLANLVRQSYLNKFPLKIIPNGVDLTKFKPTPSSFRTKHGLKDHFIVLGVAGVWDKTKGLEALVALSDKLNKEFKIVIVGVTEKQKKVLPKNIIAITRTNDVKELSQIYTAADLFVNPTLEDNFPTTNLESLACGTPVVTYKTGGSAESINDSCGITVEKDDIAALKDAVIKITNKDLNIDNCINQAKMFDMQTRFLQYINIYNDFYA